jgi:hypothetical protein
MEAHMIVPPRDVTAPKAHWLLIDVLFSNDEWSLAVGKWDGKPRIACRWNGSKKAPKGNPCSHGSPTWFMLPNDFVDLLAPLVPQGKRPLLGAVMEGAAD